MTDCAAICSAHAAKIYGINVLDTGIEDDKTNYTRFILFSHTPINPTAPTEGSPSPCKTSIVLPLPNAPDALYKVLAAFSLRDIDLTKVESRPISASALSAAIGTGFTYIDFTNNRPTIVADDFVSKGFRRRLFKVVC